MAARATGRLAVGHHFSRRLEIKSLSRENARLGKTAKTSRGRIETLEAQLAKLRATGAVLSNGWLNHENTGNSASDSGVAAEILAGPQTGDTIKT